MSDGKLDLAKSCLLIKLSAAKNQKQPEKSVRTYVQKQLGLDTAALDTLLEELARDQIVVRQTKGKTTNYQLAAAAGEYMKSLPPFPPPPPAPDEKVKCLVMMELAAAGDQLRTSKEIAAGLTPAMARALDISKATVSPAMAYLVSQRWADEEPTGKTGKDEKASYRLTDLGREELARIPEAVKALFPHLMAPSGEMQVFVLMEMLSAGDRRMLKTEIEKILGKPAGKQLGLLKQMAGAMLASLSREKWVKEELAERSGKASYLLTEAGKRELARGGQHPAATFNLSGEAINELLRHAGSGTVAQVEHVKAAAEAPAPVMPVTAPQPPAPAQLSDDALIGEAKDLLRERHGHTGLVPIFELRRRVLEKFGEQFASHSELDGRLKRLRREYRLRLVSISDRSRATPQELSESVPGEEEMFFYVGELR